MMDLETEITKVNESQEIARKLGMNLMGLRVHAWMLKHIQSLTLDQVRELTTIIKETE